jgi:hypothetical protein
MARYEDNHKEVGSYVYDYSGIQAEDGSQSDYGKKSGEDSADTIARRIE